MDETIRPYFNYALVSIGVHIFSKGNWDSRLKFVHQLFNVVVAILTFIFTTGYIITSTSDVVVWIEGVCIWITGANMYMMVAILLVFRKEFREFLEEMVFKDAILDIPLIDHVMNFPYEEGKLKVLKDMVFETQAKWLKYCSWFVKWYSAGTLATAFMYIVDTIHQMIVKEDDSLRLLAFGMWFPWKLDNFDVYIASFIFHAYAGYVCAISYPAFQSTVVLLMGQIVRQLKILAYVLENLDDLIVEIVHERNERWQFLCTSVLTQCINHYIMIKKFNNRMNVINRTFCLVLILSGMLLICVCSVKIAINHGPSYDLIKYCLHEFIFTSMVLLFCSLGQQVQNECEKLEYAVTEKWYIFNKNHRDNIKIFHLAIIQKMPIFIFGSIQLSLPTFTWFIKTGMSFFTLVMSVLED